MYATIDQIVLEGGFAVTAVCEILDVSRSGFYAWQRVAGSEVRRRPRLGDATLI